MEEQRMADIRELIIQQMERKKIGIKELAQALNVDRATVSRMLYKSKSITVTRLMEICFALDFNFLKVLADNIEVPSTAEADKDILIMKLEQVEETVFDLESAMRRMEAKNRQVIKQSRYLSHKRRPTRTHNRRRVTLPLSLRVINTQPTH